MHRTGRSFGIPDVLSSLFSSCHRRTSITCSSTRRQSKRVRDGNPLGRFTTTDATIRARLYKQQAAGRGHHKRSNSPTGQHSSRSLLSARSVVSALSVENPRRSIVMNRNVALCLLVVAFGEYEHEPFVVIFWKSSLCPIVGKKKKKIRIEFF